MRDGDADRSGGVATAQTETPAEPVRHVGGVFIDTAHHEGRLRPAIGVGSRQVFRGNRDVGCPRMVRRPDGRLVSIHYWYIALKAGARRADAAGPGGGLEVICDVSATSLPDNPRSARTRRRCWSRRRHGAPPVLFPERVEGLERFFVAVLEVSRGPVLMYHFPAIQV